MITTRMGALLLTEARRSEDCTLSLAAAVMTDAALAGVVDVEGRRFGPIDRRRVVPGPRAEDPDLAAPLADVAWRVRAASPEGLLGWFERAEVFALDQIAAEAEGLRYATRLPEPSRFRLGTPPRVSVQDAAARETARDAVEAACAGHGDDHAVALAVILRETEQLDKARGRRGLPRKEHRRLEDARRRLPPAAEAFLARLAQHHRTESMNGRYAD